MSGTTPSRSEVSSALSDLLLRVEGATGPSPELDARIMAALAAPPGSFVEKSSLNGEWCVYKAPGRLWERSSRDGWWRPGGWPLTASLDAALALVTRVLPGWAWLVSGPDKQGGAACELAHAALVGEPVPIARDDGFPDFDRDVHEGKAPTPALALLAAMLKALADADQREVTATGGDDAPGVPSHPPSRWGLT